MVARRIRIGEEAPPSGSAWGAHGTFVTLSTTDITDDTAAENNGANLSTVRGTQARGTGNYYFEVKVLSAGAGLLLIGLMDETTASGTGMNNSQIANSSMHYSFNGSSQVNGSGYTGVNLGAGFQGNYVDGDTFGVAYDATNGFHYLSLNNVWYLSGDPTSGGSGTGHVCAYSVPPSFCPAITVFVDGLFQLRTTNFDYSPPSGYSAWG